MQRHRIQSMLLVIASVSLVAWMIYILNALPTSYRAEHWNVAWFGYDFAMLTTLIATSWALWNRRQASISGAMVSATFLVIDSWFDVITSNPGWDFRLAISSACFIEIPTAYVLVRFSKNAIRHSIHNAHSRAGMDALSPSIWKTPLMIFEDI